MKTRTKASLQLQTFPLIQIFILVFLLLNIAHLLTFYRFGLHIYLNLSLASPHPSWFQYITHLFVMPLFWKPIYTFYVLVLLFSFAWVGRLMVLRMGWIRFIITFFATGLFSAILHTSFYSHKLYFGIAAPLLSFLVLTWWYYPTLLVGDLIKLRILTLELALLICCLNLIYLPTPLDTLSPMAAPCFALLLLWGEIKGQRILRYMVVRRRLLKRRKTRDIKSKVDSLLEKISREGGLEKLSKKERKFLHYASQFFQDPSPCSKEESKDPSHSKRQKTRRSEQDAQEDMF